MLTAVTTDIFPEKPHVGDILSFHVHGGTCLVGPAFSREGSGLGTVWDDSRLP